MLRRVSDWHNEYTAALRELHGCVWNAYASLDDVAASAALEHRLPVPYPISTRLYAMLLLSTFGDDGMPLPSTQAVVQLLARVRRRFGLSVPCHLVCLAEATFHAMHRRLPENVDLAAALLRASSSCRHRRQSLRYCRIRRHPIVGKLRSRCSWR